MTKVIKSGVNLRKLLPVLSLILAVIIQITVSFTGCRSKTIKDDVTEVSNNTPPGKASMAAADTGTTQKPDYPGCCE